MEFYEHGGNVFQAARELGRPVHEILDFSASINPLGMPPAVQQAARDALELAVHYPEPDAASLTAALAAHLGIPAGHLLPGSGSTDLLHLFSRVIAPRRVLLVTPAFGEYERSLRQAGTAIDIFPLAAEKNFRFDAERLLGRLEPEHDLILLANPGNPTGAGIEPAALEKLAGDVHGQALVAVDEAFVDFCPQLSVLGRVPALPNLYVFRSLTKFYAIPGLRAGYLAGPVRGIARLAAAHSPWSLSTPALAAATACLTATDFRHQTLELIPRLRRQLSQGLTGLGLTVYPSEANFLLARLSGMEAAALAAALRPQGILIRDCSNFPSLDGRFLRVAVRSADDNARLLGAIEGILGGDACR